MNFLSRINDWINNKMGIFGEKFFDEIINYRRLRLVISWAAIVLPSIVIWKSEEKLSSISASYYTDAQNWFIGLLFFISALLLVYNGHNLSQNIWSKVASIAAIVVALFPTNCDGCQVNSSTYIHYSAAALLFIILAFFCLFPFSTSAGDRKDNGKVRQKIYWLCGIMIFLCIGFMGWTWVSDAWTEEIVKEWRIIFWGELVSLSLFAFAWRIAAQVPLGSVIYYFQPGDNFMKNPE